MANSGNYNEVKVMVGFGEIGLGNRCSIQLSYRGKGLFYIAVRFAKVRRAKAAFRSCRIN